MAQVTNPLGVPQTARSAAAGVHLPGMQRRAVGGREGELARYRCRVGHAYPEDAMVARRAARSRRRCGPRWRCSRSAASCCGGSRR